MLCKLQARRFQAAQQWRSPSSLAATRPPRHAENLLRAFSGVTQAHISGGRTPITGSNLASCAASGGMKLVTFDVDGTLIHSVGDEANKLHKLAFKQAWKEVFGIDTHIDIIKHHGGTDPLILLKILECHGVAVSEGMQKLEQMQQSMVNYCTDHKSDAGQGLALLPGVVEALEELKKRGVAVALVTGNLEPIGWLKMEALGIKPLFTPPCFGGFGSDFCSGNTQEMWHDRAELIRIAAKKAAQLLGEEPSQCYHVGDTPMDVQAAVGAGAVPIGVTTGVFSAQELRDAVPGARILTSMSSKADVLKALDLEQ